MSVSELRRRTTSLHVKELAEERLRAETIHICHFLHSHRGAHQRTFYLVHQIINNNLLGRLICYVVCNCPQIFCPYAHMRSIKSLDSL